MTTVIVARLSSVRKAALRILTLSFVDSAHFASVGAAAIVAAFIAYYTVDVTYMQPNPTHGIHDVAIGLGVAVALACMGMVYVRLAIAERKHAKKVAELERQLALAKENRLSSMQVIALMEEFYEGLRGATTRPYFTKTKIVIQHKDHTLSFTSKGCQRHDQPNFAVRAVPGKVVTPDFGLPPDDGYYANVQ